MKISKDELSLELDCWVDELSPAQLAAYEKAEKEHNAVKDRLKNLMSTNEGKELFSGDFFSAYTFKGKVLQEYNDAVLPKRPVLKPIDKSQRASKKRAASNFVYIESDDEEDDIPLAKRVASLPATPKLAKKTANTTPAKSNSITQKSKVSSRANVSSPKPSPQSSKAVQEKKVASQNFRPSEVSSVGGLVVGTDKDGNKTGDSKEVKVQGKTFPSLVVLAKPWLKVKDMSSTRSKLDSKVKLVLMLTPNKFTEWLIQEGLLKSEQRCSNHRNNELKLGVYSDGAKFPYSGGYVWISECCPTRFVSVFHGSLFETAPHPPSCILKLIYHWSCQTNIQNVVQWVKVDNVYIKGVYTWLRAACTLAIHQKCKPLGGPGKYVEVGVISLGTTSQDGQQRQVKVEVLGVLDYSEKTIRLRAIEPVSDADRNYKKRFQTILEPLSRWVNKDSIIAIDLTVDKMTLYQLGFKNIVQAAANDTSARHTNSAVMDYLRRIVPRMFQNTLSLLSRQMIQQFLDELVWREQFGTYALQAFNNITAHIAEQTRMNTADTLTQRLYQVATNPFKDWSVTTLLPSSGPSTSTTPKRLKKLINDADYAPKSVKQEKSESGKKGIVKRFEEVKKTVKQSPGGKQTPTKQMLKQTPAKQPVASTSKKVESVKIKQEEDVRGLEEVYYGIKDGLELNFENLPPDYQVECPICTKPFDSNEKLQTHLVSHISIDGKDHQFQCLFCLEKHQSETVLAKHSLIMHPAETKTGSSASIHCIICQNRFNTLHLLTSHLQKVHSQLELPYSCTSCGYRSSSHRDVVRHFYDDHKNQNFLQCPFCLGVFKFFLNGVTKSENIEMFFVHLKQHLSKGDGHKKCNKCALSFKSGSLKLHQLNDHQSNARIASSIRPLLKNSLMIHFPKFRPNTKEPLPYANVMKLDKMLLCIEQGKYCAECDDEILDGEHFIGLLKCNKCPYKTCCQRAMLHHTESCSANKKKTNTPLNSEIHCVCGFSTSDGNAMADHLAKDNHLSAYPSTEIAQENTIKRNMLDLLGLMPKDSTEAGASSDTPAEGAQNTSVDETTPMDTSNSDMSYLLDMAQNAELSAATEQSSELANDSGQTVDALQQSVDDIIEEVTEDDAEQDGAIQGGDMPLLGEIMNETGGILDDDTIREAEEAAAYSQRLQQN